MRIYWSYNSIPELQGLTKLEQRMRWRHCWKQTFRHWEVWGALLAAIGIGWFGVWFSFFLFPLPQQTAGGTDKRSPRSLSVFSSAS